MKILREILTAPSPEDAVRELSHEDLCRAMAEVRALKRANDWMVEVYAMCQAEGARRFVAIASSTGFFEDYERVMNQP